MVEFQSFFQKITGKLPFPYQVSFATLSELPVFLIVITGAGKTATVVIGWLYRRKYHPNKTIRERTPRRLVYCLPMRSLVEQTYKNIELFLKNAGLQEEVELHLLMGGAVSQRWDIHPEKDCILVGTQDQLLNQTYIIKLMSGSIPILLKHSNLVGWVEERNPTRAYKCWVSLSAPLHYVNVQPNLQATS